MVSVVIPMYNSRDTIARALNSIKDQTAFEQILEIIVVNDGSNDDSLNILTKYINEHRDMPIVIINKPNGGVSSARNAGLKIVKGDWIALLDSDDEWFSDKIRIQLEILNDNPNIDFLGCNASDKGLHILWRKISKLYKANIRDVTIKCFPPTPTAIFRKQIIDEIGLFDEVQKYGEDMNYFNKICLNYNYYHLPIQLVILNGGKSRALHTGLSNNLKGMHKGNVKNIIELRTEQKISISFYLFLRMFYWIKHIRRIVISKLGKIFSHLF